MEKVNILLKMDDFKFPSKDEIMGFNSFLSDNKIILKEIDFQRLKDSSWLITTPNDTSSFFIGDIFKGILDWLDVARSKYGTAEFHLRNSYALHNRKLSFLENTADTIFFQSEIEFFYLQAFNFFEKLEHLLARLYLLKFNKRFSDNTFKDQLSEANLKLYLNAKRAKHSLSAAKIRNNFVHNYSIFDEIPISKESDNLIYTTILIDACKNFSEVNSTYIKFYLPLIDSALEHYKKNVYMSFFE